jgi:hypothetical protein
MEIGQKPARFAKKRNKKAVTDASRALTIPMKFLRN